MSDNLPDGRWVPVEDCNPLLNLVGKLIRYEDGVVMRFYYSGQRSERITDIFIPSQASDEAAA